MNKNLIENLKKEDILLSLNLINITNEGIYSNISIEANIPDYAKLSYIEPSFFNIEVEKIWTNQ